MESIFCQKWFKNSSFLVENIKICTFQTIRLGSPGAYGGTLGPRPPGSLKGRQKEEKGRERRENRKKEGKKGKRKEETKRNDEEGEST